MTWQPKSSLTVETSHWTSSNMDAVPLHSSSRLWDLDLQMKCNIYFHLKRGLWTTVQFFFSLAQVRSFWCCLWFRSGLEALFLKMSERGDSWCPDSSFSSLFVKLSKVFESPLLDSKAIPVAWAPFPTQILPSSQLCIQYTLYSISWIATPFSNDPLWLTLFMKGVNDRLLDHCQVSILPHYCGFKEQEIPGIYTVWMVINWN